LRVRTYRHIGRARDNERFLERREGNASDLCRVCILCRMGRLCSVLCIPNHQRPARINTHTRTHTQYTRIHQQICASFLEISQVSCDFVISLLGFFLVFFPREMLMRWSWVGTMVITNRVSYGSSIYRYVLFIPNHHQSTNRETIGRNVQCAGAACNLPQTCPLPRNQRRPPSTHSTAHPRQPPGDPCKSPWAAGYHSPAFEPEGCWV